MYPPIQTLSNSNSNNNNNNNNNNTDNDNNNPMFTSHKVRSLRDNHSTKKGTHRKVLLKPEVTHSDLSLHKK